MTTDEFAAAVSEASSSQAEGYTAPGQNQPWKLKWLGTEDPFTQEEQVTSYHTAAEAIRAAWSLQNLYSPSDYPQVTEPVLTPEYPKH